MQSRYVPTPSPRPVSATLRQSAGLLCLIAGAILFRVWFWHTTDITLEDAYITFRYVDNIADGHGFVYNHGERVLGTTTPLWTLLLAAVKTAGIRDFIAAAKVMGIIFDCVSIVVLFALLREIGGFAAVFGTALFVTSPAVVPITVSGMETPLLLLGMSLALLGSRERSFLFGLGLGLTVLTRIDGILFALILFGSAMIREKRWALGQGAFALALCVPWFLFSSTYFGSVFPQSFLAKREAYHLPVITSLEPFLIQFTPWGETRVSVLAIRCARMMLLTLGCVRIVMKYRHLIDVGIFFFLYTVLFAMSGAVIFAWYAVPAAFASFFIIAAGAQWCFESTGRMRAGMRRAAYIGMPVVFCAVNIATILARADRFRQMQGVEVNLRKEIGLWLHAHAPPGSQVFLEPIGYIGYYAGRGVIIRDEVGLVTPAVLRFRASGDGWYTDALKGLNPDYVVQYAYSLGHNVTEGSGQRLFRSESDRAWFMLTYREERVFDASESYPLIAPKEKKYVILKRAGARDGSPGDLPGAPDRPSEGPRTR